MLTTDVRNPPASIGEAICWASWEEDRKSNVIQTESEDGTVSVRRRYTNSWRMVQTSVTLKADIYKDFVRFFTVTVRDGIDGFWVKMPYGDVEAWRFASTPKISWTKGAEAFQVSATLVRNDAWPVK